MNTLITKKPTSTPTKILGIDPGYDRVGWAIGEVTGPKIKILSYGCIQTSKEDALTDRYRQIIVELTEVLNKYQPHELAIESLFFFKNKKTALHVSEARGVVITLCLQQQMKFAEYTPLQIKQAVTGYGRADKKSVDKMTRAQLNLSSEKIIDDAMDALAIVMTHGVSRKFPK